MLFISKTPEELIKIQAFLCGPKKILPVAEQLKFI